jgi:hypothetical protein
MAEEERYFAVTPGCKAREAWLKRLGFGWAELANPLGPWHPVIVGCPATLGRLVPQAMPVAVARKRAWADARRCRVILEDSPTYIDLVLVLRCQQEWCRYWCRNGDAGEAERAAKEFVQHEVALEAALSGRAVGGIS